MAYKRQNFADGDLLTADKLNHMEDGIVANEENASKSVKFEYQLLTETQKAQVRTNIGALGQKDIENATNVALEKAKESGEFNGADGVGVSNTEINANGELIITYTNGNSVNIGKVVGSSTNNTDNSVKPSFWSGKKLVWNGDSISYGSWLSNPTTEAYPYQVAKALGMSISNYAIGGSSAAKPANSFYKYYWDYAEWQADVSAGKVDTSKKYLVKDHNDIAKPSRIYAYSNGKWNATSETGGWALVDRVDEHIALHPDADLTVIAVGTNDFYGARDFGSIYEASYRGLEELGAVQVNLLERGNNLGYGYRMGNTTEQYEPFVPVGDALDMTLFSFQYVPVKANTRYTTSYGALRTWFLDSNKKPISSVNLNTNEGYKDFTTPKNTAYINVSYKDAEQYGNPTPNTVYMYEIDAGADEESVELVTKSTFCGAMHTICQKLLDAYKGKNKDFVFVTPIKRYQTNTWECKYPEDKNSKGQSLKDYVDAIIEICEYYSIPVIDLYRISGMNPHIDTSLFGDTDGKAVHPNLEGHKRMASFVIGFLESIRK